MPKVSLIILGATSVSWLEFKKKSMIGHIISRNNYIILNNRLKLTNIYRNLLILIITTLLEIIKVLL